VRKPRAAPGQTNPVEKHSVYVWVQHDGTAFRSCAALHVLLMLAPCANTLPLGCALWHSLGRLKDQNVNILIPAV